jgi:hypothetical protein
MQTLVSVVNSGERKMLSALIAMGKEGSDSLPHGHTTLPAYREHLHYRVTSTKQSKPVSLPERGSEAVRPTVGDAGMRSGRKRMLFRNGADIGCIRYTDNITERESGQTSLRCFTRENLTNRLMGQSR